VCPAELSKLSPTALPQDDNLLAHYDFGATLLHRCSWRLFSCLRLSCHTLSTHGRCLFSAVSTPHLLFGSLTLLLRLLFLRTADLRMRGCGGLFNFYSSVARIPLALTAAKVQRIRRVYTGSRAQPLRTSVSFSCVILLPCCANHVSQHPPQHPMLTPT
jgi:hypothetical protein